MTSAPRPPKNSRRQRTRVCLIEAARRLMAERGIEAIPISEITAEAGVGVGSFYNHFTTKENLLEAVIADTLETHGAFLDRIHEGKTDVAEMFAQNIRLTVRLVDRDPVWGAFVVRTGLYVPALRTTLGNRLVRDLRRGFEDGRFASYDEETTEHAIGGALLGVMRARLEGELSRNCDRFLAEELLRLLGLPADEAAEIAGRRLPSLALFDRQAARSASGPDAAGERAAGKIRRKRKARREA